MVTCVCAGAVNHNLQAMKLRVNSTLVTFESVTRALEVTASQLKKEQAHAVSHAQGACCLAYLADPVCMLSVLQALCLSARLQYTLFTCCLHENTVKRVFFCGYLATYPACMLCTLT